jgi:hypothetical protein
MARCIVFYRFLIYFHSASEANRFPRMLKAMHRQKFGSAVNQAVLFTKGYFMGSFGWELFIIECLIMIPFLLTLYKAFKRCSKGSCTNASSAVWLLLIPIFPAIWQFIMVFRIASSLGNEFRRKNIPQQPNPGRSLGLASYSLFCFSIILMKEIPLILY